MPLNLLVKAVLSFRTSAATLPVTQLHILQDPDPQKQSHRCDLLVVMADILYPKTLLLFVRDKTHMLH